MAAKCCEADAIVVLGCRGSAALRRRLEIGIRFFEFHHRLAELVSRDADEVDLVPKNYLHRMLRDLVLAEARGVYAAA